MNQLDRIEAKLDKLLDYEKKAWALKNIPEYLMLSYSIVNKSKNITADGVADITHRRRAVESSYLNRLANMGLLVKQRVKRKVFFSVA